MKAYFMYYCIFKPALMAICHFCDCVGVPKVCKSFLVQVRESRSRDRIPSARKDPRTVMAKLQMYGKEL